MKATKPLLWIVALTAAFWISAAPADESIRRTLATQVKAAEVHSRVLLGEVEIAPGTTVEVYGRRNGNRLILQAVSGGAAMGRGESIAGLKVTPIYVRIDSKTTRIDVLWETGN